MAFVYDKENQCYSMIINNIQFSCETLDCVFEDTAAKLARVYESRLSLIAQYIVSNAVFQEVYGTLTTKECLKLLETMTIPWIFLKDTGCHTIAYCDTDYVIEFVFSGNFEHFRDLSIDG